ncbi:MAG: aldehyde dehydrogenase, partial [Bacteroidetes bacterium]
MILKVTSPFDGHLIKEIPLMDESQVEELLANAHSLFNDRSRWLPKHQRIEILEKTAQIMSTRVEEQTKIA